MTAVMRFKGLDLNLLVALDALLEERSVTAAAARMHLSQPAMSSALGRLRRHLGDDILVPFGKRMMPTAHAEQLHCAVRALLLQVEQVVSLSTVFDPAATRRQFRIGASDYIIEVLIGPVIRHLAEVAPGIGIAVVSPSVAMGQSLLRGEIDCIITPRSYLFEGHPSELLFEDRHVLVGWTGNPLMAAPITEEQFFAAGHIAVEFGADREPAFAEQQMNGLARSRRIEVVLPSFTSMAAALIGTNRLALMHERLAVAQAACLPLSYSAIPFEFPRFEEMLQFHSTRERDAGLIWLRSVIRATAVSALSMPQDPPGLDAARAQSNRVPKPSSRNSRSSRSRHSSAK